MIARIFINKDKHFFIDGEKPLDFLYQDIDTLTMTPDFINLIIEKCVTYAINFDLWVPDYNKVKEINVAYKLNQAAALNHHSGKRVGYDIYNINKSK